MLRWTVRAFVSVAVLLIGGLLALRSDWGKSRVRDLVVRELAGAVEGELTIDRLEGSLWSSATLLGVRVTQEGQVVLSVDRLSAAYRLPALLAGDITVPQLEVDGFTVSVVEDTSGWRVKGLAPASENNVPADGGVTMEFPDVQLARGHVAIVPLAADVRQLEVASARAGVVVTGDGVAVTSRSFQAEETTGGVVVRQLAAALEVREGLVTVEGLELETARSQLSGRLSISSGASPTSTEGHVTSAGVLMAEFAPYAAGLQGAIAPTFRPSFDVTWRGPLTAMRLAGSVQSESGDVTGEVVASLADIVTVAGTVQVTRLNLGSLTGDRELDSRVSGNATLDLRTAESASLGVTGTFDARLSDARMFGYQASRLHARGRVERDEVVATLDGAAYGATSEGTIRWMASTGATSVDGRVASLDMRRLPAGLGLPSLDTALSGEYRVTVGPRDWTLHSTLDDSTVEGAALAAETVVELESRGDELTFRTSGRVSQLDTRRLAMKLDDVSQWLRETPVVMDTAFEVSGSVGDGLASHAVRFAFSDLGAAIDGARVDDMSGSGVLSAGRLAASAEGAVSGQWNRMLRFPEWDLQPEGRASVDLVVEDMTAEITPEAVQAEGRLLLGPSQLLGYDVSEAVVNARWSGTVVTFTDSRAAVAGVALTANGDLVVSGDGASRLELVVDGPDLSLLNTVLGVDLTGSGHVEGLVTGSATQPRVAGSLRGSQLAYATTRATGIDGAFDVTLPDWDIQRARGNARAEALLVEVAGQAVDRVTGSVVLDAQEADVTVGLEQLDRQVNVAGHVSAGSDRQELIIERAELRSAGESWHLVQGVSPRISQIDDRVTIAGLRLANGTQQISVEGAIGVEGAAAAGEVVLRVEAVTMESLWAMLTGDDRVHGSLQGEARVSGSLADPTVEGQFMITDGSADGVLFRSLGGKVEYRSGSANIDVHLDAGASGTLSAVGLVPVAGDSAAGTAAPLNIQLIGHMSNVGVLGPMFPMIADLKGAVDAEVLVTGTLERPVARGPATLTGVSFRAPALGVGYQALNGSVRFDDTMMVVERFAVKDEDGHELRIDGSLDVLSGGVSNAVNLRARASGFHVLKNEFGEMVVSGDLTAGGDLRAPNVLGTVRVERGLFEVDRLLREYVLARGYVPVAPAASSLTLPTSQPFADSAISIEVTLPDNVVVRGRGIQTEEGTLGLGDINLTIGGQLRMSKFPGREASLLGEVQVVRGTYDFQGRRFAIVRGSQLRFRGDDMTNPVLDITAEREISGVDVTVHIRGTAAEPTLTLSSQPVLEESDILALVAFGRPISQLGEGQKVSLAARAGTIAAGALATPLADSVARALDLDVFEIQTAEGIGSGTAVLVGRQLSDKLFVGFRHKFGAEGGQRLTLEYRLAQFLRIVSTIAPGGDAATLAARTEGSGIDLIFVIRR